MEQQKLNNEQLLIESLRDKVKKIDKDIDNLHEARKHLLKTIDLLQDTDSTLSKSNIQRHRRTKPYSKVEVIDAIVDLCNKFGRPVNFDEISNHVHELKIKIGRMVELENGDIRIEKILRAIIANEIKSPNAKIVRVDRGLYDIADKSSIEPTLTAHPIVHDSTQAVP